MSDEERLIPKEPSVKDPNVNLYEVNAGCPAFVKIVQTEVNKLNDNLIKTVKDNVGVNDYKSNVKALMTDWNLSDRYIDRLHQIIEEHLPPTEHKLFEREFNFIETWGAIYKHQDFCKVHHHWPNTYSWVYFAQVDDDSAPLDFYNIMRPDEKELANIRLKPKVGQLIIFPSFVMHGSDKTSGIGEDKWRIVLAGNIVAQYDTDRSR